MRAKAHKYSTEERDYIRENYKGISTYQLTERFNKKFGLELGQGAIRSYITKRKWKNGVVTRFEKGKVKDNGYRFKKGDGRGVPYQFQKGHISHNTKPIGSTLIRNGYKWIKVAMPNVWELIHHQVWCKSNGDIPKSHAVMFLDGDRGNITIENLALVSKAQMGVLNRLNLIQPNKQATETGILISELIIKQAEVKKQIEKKEN